MILTELAPLTPDSPSSTLSWMYCEKLKSMPTNSLANSLLQLVDQLFLGQARRPLVERLQRHEEFGVEEARRVAAVVRPAVLRNDRDDLGMAQQDLADLVDDRHAGFQRYGRRHGGADPQIAFLERRQEFAAEPRAEQADDDQEDATPIAIVILRCAQRPAQHRRVDPAQRRARRSSRPPRRAPGAAAKRGTASP